MNKIKYHLYIWATSACTKSMIKPTKGLGNSNIKGATKDFLFLVVGLPQRGWLKMQWMLVLTSLIWQKPNTKGLCRDSIKDLTKGWPESSYLVLNITSMLPSYRPLTSIVYESNYGKVS